MTDEMKFGDPGSGCAFEPREFVPFFGYCADEFQMDALFATWPLSLYFTDSCPFSNQLYSRVEFISIFPVENLFAALELYFRAAQLFITNCFHKSSIKVSRLSAVK